MQMSRPKALTFIMIDGISVAS